MNDSSSSNNLPAVPHDDGWGSVPPAPPRLIRGKPFKFKEGAYFVNREPLLDDELQLLVTGVLVAWVRWKDGTPEYRVTKPGQRHPDREELGDNDKKQWPVRFDEPEDPWKDTRYMYCIDPKTAQDYTFITDTVGGRRAVSDLRNQIANVRCAHPSAIPFIAFASEEMPTKRGSQPKPYFKVIEWRPGREGDNVPLHPAEGADDASNVAPNPNAVLPAPKPMKPARRDDFDDEIPF